MKNLQGKLPILLSVAFVASVLAFGGVKVASWSGAARWIGGGVLALYVAWLLAEARVAVGELGKGATSLDQGTLEAYALGRAITVISALALEAPAGGAARMALGAALFAGAVALRLAAIRELGRFYSHRVRVVGGHRIVDTGPYGVVRHPAYTGMLLAHLGFVLVFFHPLSLAIFALLFVPAVVARIRVEEQALMKLDGYADYSRARRRLLPMVW